MARVRSPKRQATTVGLAKLAEQLRYDWERKHPRRAPAQTRAQKTPIAPSEARRELADQG